MKALVIFGTRPEGIKMAPIIKELKKADGVELVTCITSQHRELLDSVIKVFDLEIDYDLNIFEKGQTLTDITVRSLKGLEEVINKEKPDLVLVQGDTTTVFAGALEAFYNGVKIGHVEAGLRSGNILSPFPEEANRKLTGIMTDFHFCPTQRAKENLIKEGYDEKKLYITGNTVIDALLMTADKVDSFTRDDLKKIDLSKRLILLTSHRRENQGEPMENIFGAVRKIADEFNDVNIVFPMHPNPRVRELAKKHLDGLDNVILTEPVEYEDMAYILKHAYMVVTDSGGLQEEAPALGVPVLVIRRETERPEGIEYGTAKLVGTEFDSVYNNMKTLLTDKDEYTKMHKAINPYGDGNSAKMIKDILIREVK